MLPQFTTSKNTAAQGKDDRLDTHFETSRKVALYRQGSGFASARGMAWSASLTNLVRAERNHAR